MSLKRIVPDTTRSWVQVLSLALVGGLVLPLVLAACGLIIHGGKQTVGISSSPSAAQVSVDNKQVGETPVNVKLEREDDHWSCPSFVDG